jgi:hypothetical protein
MTKVKIRTTYKTRNNCKIKEGQTEQKEIK